MPTTAQSLITGVAKHNSAAAPRPAQLLRIALLQSIANTLAPSVATDPQSLLSSANVAGYQSAGLVSVGDMLELALLQIIANNVGSGGSSGVSSGAGAPTNGVTTGTFYYNSTDQSFWASSNNGTTWQELLA